MGKLALRIVAKSLFASLVTVAEAMNGRMNSLIRLPYLIPMRRNLRERRVLARRMSDRRSATK